MRGSVDERINAALMSASGALPIVQLHAICRVRSQHFTNGSR